MSQIINNYYKFILNSILFILILLFSIFNIFGVLNSQVNNLNQINFINFNNMDKLNMNLVSYEILYVKNYSGDVNFELEVIYNNIETYTCSKKLLMDGAFISKKIICSVPKFGFGSYNFSSKLFFKNKLIDSNEAIKFLKPKLVTIFLKDTNSSINFESLANNRTKITLFLNSIDKKLIIENEIPKSVIAYLDENNKYLLIFSNLSYTIINSDPIIAWNLAPKTSNLTYIINKKISRSEMGNFKLKIKENKTFDLLKIIIFFLILLIVFLVFKPLFKKK